MSVPPPQGGSWGRKLSRGGHQDLLPVPMLASTGGSEAEGQLQNLPKAPRFKPTYGDRGAADLRKGGRWMEIEGVSRP